MAAAGLLDLETDDEQQRLEQGDAAYSPAE
jgi:hypothetical protein